MAFVRVLSIVAALAAVAASPQPMTKVRLAQGVLNGRPDGAVSSFLGVPFAAPPIGDLRWRPPAPAPAWTGVRRADRFSASCRQAITPNGFGPWTREYVVHGAVSEDCLYLNVWTPARRTTAHLPVMVWIHGGGFSSGSGSVPIYDGARLASQGIIVVTINYRVGVYGFLALEELAAESPGHAAGNYGLLDQIAALRWVRANIGAFGGDPDRVTVAGQSAGAASVHDLIASPAAKGLFERAIAESGSGMGLPIPDQTQARAMGARFMSEAGVGDLAALRRLPADRIDAAASSPSGSSPAVRFGPTVDGIVLPSSEAVGGNVNDTPILTGMTANEMSSLDPSYGKATVETLGAQIAGRYGGCADHVRAYYAVPAGGDANVQVDMLARDRVMAASLFWARQRLISSRQPVYMYRWDHSEPGPQSGFYKAFHSSEIPYVFGTLSASPDRPFTSLDRRLSDRLGRYWVNWVKTGNPNGPGLLRWPALTPSSSRILVIGDRIRSEPALSTGAQAVFQRCADAGVRFGIL